MATRATFADLEYETEEEIKYACRNLSTKAEETAARSRTSRQQKQSQISATNSSKSDSMQLVLVNDPPESPVQLGVHEQQDPGDPEYIFKFIRRVRSTPMVYNQEDENFRNIPLKNQAWKQIALEFNQEQSWCMKKWISLRDYFVKRKKLQRMGKPARPWIYYNELKFLNSIYGQDEESPSKKFREEVPETVTYRLADDLLSFHDEASNSLSNSGLEHVQEFENDPDDDELEMLEDSHQGSGAGSLADFYTSNSSSQRQGKKRRMDIFTNSLSITNTNSANNSSSSHGLGRNHIKEEEADFDLESEEVDEGHVRSSRFLNENGDSDNSHHVNQSRDAYDLFCLSVAAQMRNMPRAKALQMQVKIMELMYDSEFPQYSNKCIRQ